MVLWIQDISDNPSERVGWKVRNMSKVNETGLKVPKGFVIPAEVFKKFQEQERISNRIENEHRGLDSYEDCERASENIQRLVSERDISEELIEEFKEAYSEINVDSKVRKAGKKAVNLVGGQRASETVVVRISPAERKEKDIYPPEIGVKSKKGLKNAIKKMWKEYFSPEAVYYRKKKGISSTDTALVVQKAVESEISGSVFTRSPSDRELIEMESCYGLGTGIKNGKLVPDRFMVERKTGRIIEKDIATKKYKMAKNPATGKIGQQPVPSEKRDKKSLSNEKFSEIVNNSLQIEKKFGRPVRVDFSIERNQVFITGIASVEKRSRNTPSDKKEILKGIPAGKGTVKGEANIIYSPEQRGESIAVFREASKDYIRLLAGSKAIIAEKGGRSSYLTTICNSLDFPSLLRTKDATEKLEKGQKIVLRTGNGTVVREEDHEEKEKISSIETVTATDIKDHKTVSEPQETENGYIRYKGEDYPLVDSEEEKGFLRAGEATKILNTNSREGIMLDISLLKKDLNPNGIQEILEKSLEKTEKLAILFRETPDRPIIDIGVEKGVNLFIAGEDVDKVKLGKKVAESERAFMLERLREMDR